MNATLETCRGCGTTFETYECFNEVTGESDGNAEYCVACVAANIGEVEVLECGCIGYPDGTGEPCAVHHPDYRGEVAPTREP